MGDTKQVPKDAAHGDKTKMDRTKEREMKSVANSALHTREDRLDAVADSIKAAKTRKTAEITFLLDQCKRAIRQLYKYEIMVVPAPPDYATTLGLQFDDAIVYLEGLTAPKSPTTAK